MRNIESMSRPSQPKPKPTIDIDMVNVARAALAAEGESPDAWLIMEQHDQNRSALLIATPPLAIAAQPPAFRAAMPYVHAATRIIVTQSGIESIGVASRGYVGAILCDISYSKADDIEGYVTAVRDVAAPDANLALIIRRTIGQMMRAAHTMTADEQWLVDDAPKMSLRALPAPDGRVAYTYFSADVTLGDLWQAYSRAGSRANLLRLRHGAPSCGGCGRCCYDSDISISRFDVESVASHQLSATYKRNRALAVSQTRALMADERPATHDTLLPDVSSFYFAKKKSGAHTGGRQGACIYLAADGMCGAYEGRPLLCRLYICAGFTPAAEEVYRSAIDTIEWYGRALDGGAQTGATIPPTLDPILATPLRNLATPYALSLADIEAGNWG